MSLSEGKGNDEDRNIDLIIRHVFIWNVGAETATDADYERIEGVIGHEYFHNWTGNRVTCK